MTKEYTLGENRVRIDFNQNRNDLVGKIKQKTAELIDIIDDFESEDVKGEIKRLKSIAQTKYEEAGLWAVKAVTSSSK